MIMTDLRMLTFDDRDQQIHNKDTCSEISLNIKQENNAQVFQSQQILEYEIIMIESLI